MFRGFYLPSLHSVSLCAAVKSLAYNTIVLKNDHPGTVQWALWFQKSPFQKTFEEIYSLNYQRIISRTRISISYHPKPSMTGLNLYHTLLHGQCLRNYIFKPTFVVLLFPPFHKFKFPYFFSSLFIISTFRSIKRENLPS